MPDGLLSSPNVLYFPHIEMRDSAWLKSALCIWDSIYRIVPTGYRPNDSDDIKQAIDADALRNITLSIDDLKQARENYHDFLESVSIIPDAIGRPARDRVPVHHEKLDEAMQAELSDLLGTLTRDGDWLELPRGVADGYLLFLADAVARRRAIPKLTDSDTMFVAMQYFAVDGKMDEMVLPSADGDMSTALIFRYLSPAGIHERKMKDVLSFRAANSEGRQAFRQAVDTFAAKLTKVEDEGYARELMVSFIRNLQESEKFTLARIREYFERSGSILICFGAPVAVKAFEVLASSSSNTFSLGAVAVSIIYAIADITKSRRTDWVPSEATYLAKIREEFVGDTPIPDMCHFHYMMNEFMND